MDASPGAGVTVHALADDISPKGVHIAQLSLNLGSVHHDVSPGSQANMQFTSSAASVNSDMSPLIIPLADAGPENDPVPNSVPLRPAPENSDMLLTDEETFFRRNQTTSNDVFAHPGDSPALLGAPNRTPLATGSVDMVGQLPPLPKLPSGRHTGGSSAPGNGASKPSPPSMLPRPSPNMGPVVPQGASTSFFKRSPRLTPLKMPEPNVSKMWNVASPTDSVESPCSKRLRSDVFLPTKKSAHPLANVRRQHAAMGGDRSGGGGGGGGGGSGIGGGAGPPSPLSLLCAGPPSPFDLGCEGPGSGNSPIEGLTGSDAAAAASAGAGAAVVQSLRDQAHAALKQAKHAALHEALKEAAVMTAAAGALSASAMAASVASPASATGSAAGGGGGGSVTNASTCSPDTGVSPDTHLIESPAFSRQQSGEAHRQAGAGGGGGGGGGLYLKTEGAAFAQAHALPATSSQPKPLPPAGSATAANVAGAAGASSGLPVPLLGQRKESGEKRTRDDR